MKTQWSECRMSLLKKGRRAATISLHQAVQRGMFGAPTLMVTRGGDQNSELFFGSDRMHLLADYLGSAWPMNGMPRGPSL
eukprot:EC799402.1.p4 GENE.EC799402.1~~EC799402.1.p4  ORF type:complete len:80 (+),score=3.81 EC799402.1:471-710(+)